MRRLALFARWPERERVKTRLSPALPEGGALRLHQAMLDAALDALRGAHVEKRLLFWADAPPDAATPERCERRDQAAGDLGARLTAAFGDLLATPGDGAVIVGSDLPGIGSARLDDAFAALESHDAVIAASRDGGYSLIGLSRAAPVLFRAIPWSTARVLATTRTRAHEAGLIVHELEPLDDLDTPEDLARWIAIAARDPDAIAQPVRVAMMELGLLA